MVDSALNGEAAAFRLLLAATLARTFNTQAELRAWGENATASALEWAEAHQSKESADLYRQTIDEIVAFAVRVHGESTGR